MHFISYVDISIATDNPTYLFANSRDFYIRVPSGKEKKRRIINSARKITKIEIKNRE